MNCICSDFFSGLQSVALPNAFVALFGILQEILVCPRTGHDGPEGGKDIALLFH